MFSILLPLLTLLPVTLSQAPPIQGDWTLIDIITSGPIIPVCEGCAQENAITFTIQETNTTCTTSWLPPNKPIDWVPCDKSNYHPDGSNFSFKFPAGEDTRYDNFTLVIFFDWRFSVGPVGGSDTMSLTYQGEKLIDDLSCVPDPDIPGEDICMGGPESVVVGS